LVDSEGLHADSWVQALAEHGIAFSYEDYPKYAGKEADLVAEALAREYSQLDPGPLAESKRRIFARMQDDGISAVPGAVEFVRALVAHKEALGIRIGLASASTHEEIEGNLAAIGLSGLFDTVVSGRDDLDGYVDASGRNKPKPYIYMEAARRLGVEAAHCVAFEDTDVGVTAASSAGMRVFAVPNAWTRTQHFDAAAAVLDSLQSCMPALR
jgi:HAD superfamily hydrolase (TIGR01509 family)